MLKKIDLGLLGSALVEPFNGDYEVYGKKILYDGHTEWGVRIHVIEGNSYPRIYNNSVSVGVDFKRKDYK